MDQFPFLMSYSDVTLMSPDDRYAQLNFHPPPGSSTLNRTAAQMRPELNTYFDYQAPGIREGYPNVPKFAEQRYESSLIRHPLNPPQRLNMNEWNAYFTQPWQQNLGQYWSNVLQEPVIQPMWNFWATTSNLPVVASPYHSLRPATTLYEL